MNYVINVIEYFLLSMGSVIEYFLFSMGSVIVPSWLPSSIVTPGWNRYFVNNDDPGVGKVSNGLKQQWKGLLLRFVGSESEGVRARRCGSSCLVSCPRMKFRQYMDDPGIGNVSDFVFLRW